MLNNSGESGHPFLFPDLTVPGSSPSRIQGYPRDNGIGDKESKKREKEA